MKTFLKTTIVLLTFIFSSFSAVNAADYIVQKGDTLTSVSKATGQTIDELRLMNQLPSTEITTGQTLLYISQTDIQFANMWFVEVMFSSKANGDLRYIADTNKSFLFNRNIQYGNNPNGIHFTTIIEAVMFEKNRLNREYKARRNK